MNLTLMRFYELPRLPLLYLPVSAVILLLLGQAAGTAAGAACRGHRAGVGHPFVVESRSGLGRSLLPSASENSHAQDARRQQSVPGG